jgi:hypothetical protein
MRYKICLKDNNNNNEDDDDHDYDAGDNDYVEDENT